MLEKKISSLLQLSSRRFDSLRLNIVDLCRILDSIEKQIIIEFSVFDRIIDFVRLNDSIYLPKPQSKTQVIKGIGKRRKEDALIYRIPSKNNESFSEKGVNRIEFNRAFRFLYWNKSFSRKILKRCFQNVLKKVMQFYDNWWYF